MRTVVRLALIALLVPAPLSAQNRSEDEYTRYELLAPDTASFKIIYDVTAVSAGAKFFFNPIRRGSIASDESVIDLMTGAPLKFTEVSDATLACKVFAPAIVPSVHDVTVATPFASVVALPPATLPPPPVTVNVTLTP